MAELVDELSQLRYLESEEVGYLEMEAQAGRGEEIVVPEGRVSLEAVRSRQVRRVGKNALVVILFIVCFYISPRFFPPNSP